MRFAAYYSFFVFFFFSSRRRHTRCSRDWSSDVCSSDLPPVPLSRGERGDHSGVALTIPVRDGTAQPATTKLALHPVGRLVARVVLRAGAGVEEAVVESDVYDLSAGAKLGDDLAGAFGDLEAGRGEPADASLAGAAQPGPAPEPAELATVLPSPLQEKSAAR